jgi:hypothetical protein
MIQFYPWNYYSEPTVFKELIESFYGDKLERRKNRTIEKLEIQCNGSSRHLLKCDGR